MAPVGWTGSMYSRVEMTLGGSWLSIRSVKSGIWRS
jgi:hypothetical protein